VITLRFDRRHITAASATGAGVLVGGASVRSLDDDDAPSGDTATVILAMACATALALVSLRRWIAQYETRTKANLDTLAHEHADRAADLARQQRDLERREEDLTSREDAFVRREHFASLRAQSTHDRITNLARSLRAEEQAHQELRINFTELAAEHDTLVRQVVREGAARFAGTCYEPFPRPSERDGHPRALAHPRDPSPLCSPVAEFRPRERHESV